MNTALSTHHVYEGISKRYLSRVIPPTRALPHAFPDHFLRIFLERIRDRIIDRQKRQSDVQLVLNKIKKNEITFPFSLEHF